MTQPENKNVFIASRIQRCRENVERVQFELDYLESLGGTKYDCEIASYKNILEHNKQEIAACEAVPDTAQWIPLKIHDGYEILSNEPHSIKKKTTQNIVVETLINDSSYRCVIGGKYYMKHRILAHQFLGFNLDDKNMIIVHVDGDTKNNSLSNLRITTRQQHQLCQRGANGVTYEYVDTLPEGAKPVLKYNQHSFDNIFYSNGDFFLRCHRQIILPSGRLRKGASYRKLLVSKTKPTKKAGNQLEYVAAKSVDGKQCKLIIAKVLEQLM